MPAFFATCPRGLEKLLVDEVRSCGATDVVATEGGVSFTADWPICYRINLQSRIATRVLWRVLSPIRYRQEQDIYQAVYDLPWSRWFDAQYTIKVRTVAIRSPLKSLDFITLKIKDALCDKFRVEKKVRPSVAKLEPDFRIQAFLERDQFSLYVDTSGEALYKRGVRKHRNIAPLKENLAAGILLTTGWQPGVPLFDPMCGGGTFLLEAAMMSLNIQPGIARHFAFEKLKNFDAKVWEAMCTAAREAQQTVRPLPIYGSDIAYSAIKLAQRNLEDAELSAAIELVQRDILEVTPPAETGVLLANLPYGERMGEEAELAALYPKLGDVLKQRFGGWDAYLFTSDLRITKLMRLRSSKRTPLYNGALECRLFEYKIVKGSNRS